MNTTSAKQSQKMSFRLSAKPDEGETDRPKNGKVPEEVVAAALSKYRDALPVIKDEDVRSVFEDKRIKIVDRSVRWHTDEDFIKIGDVEFETKKMLNSIRGTRARALQQAKNAVRVGIGGSSKFGPVQDSTFIVRAVPWLERNGFHVHLTKFVHLDADTAVTSHDRYSFCMEVQNHKNNVFAEIYGVSGRRGYLLRYHGGSSTEDRQQVCKSVMEVKKILSQIGYVELNAETVDIDAI